MVNLHILTLEKSSKCQKTYKKESKTSVFDSFLTESVISVNVDGKSEQKRYFYILLCSLKLAIAFKSNTVVSAPLYSYFYLRGQLRGYLGGHTKILIFF